MTGAMEKKFRGALSTTDFVYTLVIYIFREMYV